MATGDKTRRDLAEMKALRAKLETQKQAAVARAVANYLDGSAESIEAAALGQGVSENAVGAAVRAAKKAGKR